MYMQMSQGEYRHAHLEDQHLMFHFVRSAAFRVRN